MKVFLILILSSLGFAQTGTSSDTKSLLIQKLEKVNLELAPNDPSKVSVSLRLADLLADRARIDAMNELEKGCSLCQAGEADRKRALSLYLEVLPKVPAVNLGRVLIQMGHLYELNGQEKEAQQNYEKVFNSNVDSKLKAEASLSLAEMAFKRNQFAQARKAYEFVLTEKQATSRGLAAYRMAWCDYRMGNIGQAVESAERILNSPELQSRSGVAEAQADLQFLEEVSRDMATFMAQGAFSSEQMKKLYGLSPASVKLSNAILLSQELERTGKKKEAALAWKFVWENSPQPQIRLEALVHLIPLSYSESDSSQSMEYFSRSIAQWKELGGCGKSDCADVVKIYRQFLVNWNQSEKKQASENLIKAYELFLEVVKDDYEIALWGAEAAQSRSDFLASARMTEQAINVLLEKHDEKRLESTLLGYLELAEKSKNEDLWSKASELYLIKSPAKTKFFEVQYQRAKRAYDKAQYQQAADQLKALALVGQAPLSIRIQAANLALDALVFLKQDLTLKQWAGEFSELFSSEKSGLEFAQIQQKAILTQASQLATTDSEKAWQELLQFNAKKATQEDLKLYLKNKILLAEKTSRYDSAASAVDEYLMQTLTTEEKDFAYGRKAWFAELKLDFKTAKLATEKLSSQILPMEKKVLKLALFAELSGEQQLSFYQDFLKISKDEEAKQGVAAQIVRQSKDPMKAWEMHAQVLSKNPDLMARLYAEILVKPENSKLLSSVLAQKKFDHRVKKSTWGKNLEKASLIQDLQSTGKKISELKLSTKTQKALNLAIRQRASELKKLETMVSSAIQMAEWSPQVMALSLYARENERFYQELMALPMPEGLSPEEENQYMQLLGQQAAPFKTQADQALAKVNELWNTTNWKEGVSGMITQAAHFYPLIEIELNGLKEVSSAENQEFLANTLSELEKQKVTASGVRVEMSVIEQARNEVRAHPLDLTRLQTLKELENTVKNTAMVQYLEGRMKHLQEQTKDGVK